MEYQRNIQHSAAYIQEKLGKIQDGCVAIVTGTGLGGLTEAIDSPVSIPYAGHRQLPGVHGQEPHRASRVRFHRRRAGPGP